MDETEGNGVGTNTERTPFLGEGFGKTSNCRLGGSIISLTDVSVKTRSRGDVNDGTVLRITLALYEYHNGDMNVRKRHTLMRI